MKTLIPFEIPTLIRKDIEAIIHQNRMLYEPFLDSVASYDELKKRLIAQGYKNIPEGEILMMDLGNKIPEANTKGYKIKRTMIRKSK